MAKKMELEEILEKNPHINAEMLKQAIELLEKLRESGVKGSSYNLTSPYARRRSVTTSNANWRGHKKQRINI